MNRALLLREFKRLLPYGLGGLALIVLAFVMQRVPRFNRSETLLFMFLLVPAALGVACVAPDSGSGATAFMRRQPINPSSVLAAKILAALAWLIPNVLLMTWFLLDVSAQPEAIVGSWMFVVFPIFSFGSGLLASVIAFRTMPAILLTPAIGLLAATVSIGFPAAFLGLMPPTVQFIGATLTALGVTFVGLAFLAYTRGEPHRRSARPAGLAFAGLTPLLVLGLTGTSLAHSWTVEAVVPELKVSNGVAESPTHVAVPIQGYCWTGVELRVALIERETQETWVLPPRGVWYPQFDPAGERLLVRNLTFSGGWLVDVESRTLEPLKGRSKEGFGYPEVLWRERGPLLLQVRRQAILTFDPLLNVERKLLLAEPAIFVGVQQSTGRVLVRDGEGILALTIPADLGPAQQRLKPGERLIRWTHWRPSAEGADPEVFADVVLSPGGRFALCRENVLSSCPYVYSLETGRWLSLDAFTYYEPQPSRAEATTPRAQAVTSVEEGGAVVSHATEPLFHFGNYAFGFSPGDRHLLIERSGGPVVFADLDASTWTRIGDAEHSFPGRAAVWSPDGRFGTLPSGTSVDTTSGKAVSLAKPRQIAAYLAPTGVVRVGRELGVDSIGGGTFTSLLEGAPKGGAK